MTKSTIITVLCICFLIIAVCESTYCQIIEWTKTYGGPLGDYGVRIIPTPDSGYAFLGRTFSYAVGNDDYYLLKLDSLGDTLWSQTYGGTEGVAPQDIINTNDGGFMICGSNSNYAYEETFFALKTDGLGNETWVRSVGYRGRADAVIQTDDSGYVFAGFNKRSETRGYLAKLSAAGDSLWAVEFGTDNDFCTLSDVIEIGVDSFLAVGYYSDEGVQPASNKIFAALVRDSLVLWQNTYGSSPVNRGKCVLQLLDGTIVIAGYQIETGEPADIVLLEIDQSGDSLWYRTMGTDGLGQTPSDMIITDDTGFVLCATSGTSTPAPVYESWISKLSHSLAETNRYIVDSAYDEVHAYSLARTWNGGLVLGGYCNDPTMPLNMYALTMMSDGTFTSVNDDAPNELPHSFRLYQNYPNPFNPSTTIKFSLAEAAQVRLDIYNVLGQKVEFLVDQVLPPGQHTVTWDAADYASGAYFYRLSTGEFVETKRMVLLK